MKEDTGKIFNGSPYVKELCDILGCLTPDAQKFLLIIAKELFSARTIQSRCYNLK